MSDRAASPVLGITLLFGFTVAAALSMMVAGTLVISAAQDGSKSGQAARSMVETSSEVNDLLLSEQDAGEFSFANAGGGTPRVDPDAGFVNITHHNGSNTEHLLNSSIGSFEFEQEGTTYAYQSGGVWKRGETGKASMVEPPQVYYNYHTLTLPIVNITGDVTAGDQDGTIHVGDSERIYPDPGTSDRNPLRNGSITVEVNEPNYCSGWEEFFRERTSGELTESCGADNVMRVTFSVPFTLSDISEGVYTGTHQEGANRVDDSDVNEDPQYSAQSADNIIEAKREECESFDSTNFGGSIDTGGLHCASSIDGSVEFNTDSAGEEIEVYVDGDVTLEGGDMLMPHGTRNVSLYVNGSLTMKGNSVLGNGSTASGPGPGVSTGGGGNGGNNGGGNGGNNGGGNGNPAIGFTSVGSAGAGFNSGTAGGTSDHDPTQTRVFISSNGGFETLGGNPKFYGLLYAPHSTVEVTGSGGIEGAVIADTFDGNGNAGLVYDEAFEDITIKRDQVGEPFYYLHIVEKDVRFQGR